MGVPADSGSVCRGDRRTDIIGRLASADIGSPLGREEINDEDVLATGSLGDHHRRVV
jgi:hypothetical protein